MSEWIHDPVRQEWTHRRTGQTLTAEAVRRLPPGQAAAVMAGDPLIQSNPWAPSTDHKNRPLLDDIDTTGLNALTIIRFLTHGRFTYAALYVPVAEHDKCWYLTGAGKWFGTNALTNDQMSEVLQRETTSHIRVMMPLSDDAASILT